MLGELLGLIALDAGRKALNNIGEKNRKKNLEMNKTVNANYYQAPAVTYQCMYCGKSVRVTNPRFLPKGGTGCRAQGMKNLNSHFDHVWRQLY